MHWFDTAGAGRSVAAGVRGPTDQMNGNAVMYALGKILAFGGAKNYNTVPGNPTTYAVADATVITIGAPFKPAKITPTAPLNRARSFSNAVVLPDGKVLAIGGMVIPLPFSDTTAVTVPEIWDPATGKWTLLVDQLVPRTYHSVALLLPDATVLSTGGGLCAAAVCNPNHPDGQRFHPPYLFLADGKTRTPRPLIRTAPATAKPGSLINVRVRLNAESEIKTFALIRYGSATHSVNTDQRRIELPIVGRPQKRVWRLRVPGNYGTTPRGVWMLFAINAASVPSVAKTVLIV